MYAWPQSKATWLASLTLIAFAVGTAGQCWGTPPAQHTDGSVITCGVGGYACPRGYFCDSGSKLCCMIGSDVTSAPTTKEDSTTTSTTTTTTKSTTTTTTQKATTTTTTSKATTKATTTRKTTTTRKPDTTIFTTRTATADGGLDGSGTTTPFNKRAAVIGLGACVAILVFGLAGYFVITRVSDAGDDEEKQRMKVIKHERQLPMLKNNPRPRGKFVMLLETTSQNTNSKHQRFPREASTII
eukprot:m.70843 g.70843  ORF g.70843 m.70843 type:complete len:242 (-) comp12271_c0_seq2:1496-2221(-)